MKLIDYGSARRIKNWKEGDMLAIVSYAAFTGRLLQVSVYYIQELGNGSLTRRTQLLLN